MPGMKLRLFALCLALALPAVPAAGEQGKPSLERELAALSSFVEQQRGKLGVVFVELGSGRVLASSGADLPLNPASNAKIFTIAAALARLGPEYRFVTSVHGRIQGGLAPRLVLRGHGDPSLGSSDLAALARELSRLGLRRVEGDILVDQSRFDDRFVPPGFEQQPDEWAAFRAPVSAVAVDRNALTLHVVPSRRGTPARAWVEPPGFVELSGSVATAPPGSGQRVALSLRAEAGKLRAELGGTIAEGLPRAALRRRVDDPRTLAGHVLAHFLRQEGVELAGGVSEGGANERGLIARHVSLPLATMIHELGKRSDNFYAEMLLKALGAEASGGAGTSAAGAAAIGEWLKSAGAFEPGTRITNGSGLFDTNRVSAGSIGRALAQAFGDPRIGAELVSGLAVGGVDGTLRSRFRAHAHSRAIRAKTGSLRRSVALSGYLLAPSRPPVAFSIVVNDVTQKQAELRRQMDRVVEAALGDR
jgi:serine-type D-Ala-D-Ala carboxypeptidase/endopeptidase (penicillin-binding protein 4)